MEGDGKRFRQVGSALFMWCSYVRKKGNDKAAKLYKTHQTQSGEAISVT